MAIKHFEKEKLENDLVATIIGDSQLIMKFSRQSKLPDAKVHTTKSNVTTHSKVNIYNNCSIGFNKVLKLEFVPFASKTKWSKVNPV